MQELLVIDTRHRNVITKIIKKLNKKQSDCCVSFIIDPKANTLQLIGGHAPEYLHFTIPLAVNHQLTKRRFTIDGEYFSQLPGYAGKGNMISLEIIIKPDKPKLVGITTEKDEFLSAEFAPFYQAHQEYVKEIGQHAYQEIRALEMSRLLHEGNTHSPFQFIAIDKEKNEFRVQSDNNQELYDIPKNVPIPLSLVLTQEATHELQVLCEKVGDQSIQIAQHDENITFKTSDSAMTISMSGVEEFYKNKPKDYKQIGYMIMDINHLKDRVIHFNDKYTKIKRANQSHLLIDPTQLYFLNLVTPYQFSIPIASDAISLTETQLYMLHLSDIVPIKIKDVTTSDKVKIAILKEVGQERVYKLGFYKDITHKYFYASVLIEPAPDDMDNAQAVIKNAQNSKQQGGSEGGSDGEQGDMFGFDL